MKNTEEISYLPKSIFILFTKYLEKNLLIDEIL